MVGWFQATAGSRLQGKNQEKQMAWKRDVVLLAGLGYMYVPKCNHEVKSCEMNSRNIQFIQSLICPFIHSRNDYCLLCSRGQECHRKEKKERDNL